MPKGIVMKRIVIASVCAFALGAGGVIADNNAPAAQAAPQCRFAVDANPSARTERLKNVACTFSYRARARLYYYQSKNSRTEYSTTSGWAYLNGTTNNASFPSGYLWSHPSYDEAKL
jgi:hypothetical protein